MADVSIIISTNAKEASNKISGLSDSITKSAAKAKQLTKAFDFLDKSLNKGKIDAQRYSKLIQQLDKEEADLYRTLGKTTSALNKQSGAMARGAKTAGAAALAAKNLANAQRMSGKATNKFGMYSQQVGYQVGDFLVQVQSGTNAMVAFGQQGTQLAGLIPGIGGAIVGIGLSLATAIALSTGATDKISFDWKKLLADLQVGIEAPTAKVVSFFGLMWEGIKSYLNKIVDGVNFLINTFRTIVAVAAALPKAMKAGFDGIPDLMAAAAAGMTVKFLEGISEMLHAFQSFTWAVAEGLNELFNTNLSGANIPFISSGAALASPLDLMIRKADNLQSRAERAAKGTTNAVTVIQDAINSVEPIDIRDYFGAGSGDEAGGGGLNGKTLEEVEAHKKLALAYGEEADKLRLVLEIKDQLGDNLKNYTQAAIEGAADRIRAYEAEQEALRKADEQTQSIADTLQSSMSDAFMSMVDGTKSFKDAMKDMARAVIKQLFEVLVVQQMVGSFDSKTKTGSGLVGAIMGAFQANGGAWQGGSQIQAYANGGVVGGPTTFPMAGGKTGLMGEAGPEAIMPLKRGANGKLGVQMEGNAGGDVIINQSFNFQANGDDSVKRIIQQQIPRITEATKAAVADSKRRGGSYGRAFG